MNARAKAKYGSKRVARYSNITKRSVTIREHKYPKHIHTSIAILYNAAHDSAIFENRECLEQCLTPNGLSLIWNKLISGRYYEARFVFVPTGATMMLYFMRFERKKKKREKNIKIRS